MKVLLAPTENDIKLEHTELNADASAGSSVALTILSNDNIGVNDYVVIGQEGSETAELQQVSTVIGNTGITVGVLKFTHKANEPVTKYRFNKRKFYGATSKTGSYTELTGDGSPKLIQVDDPQGTILEYTGSTYTFFKATYFNSTTNDETDIEDAEAVEADESIRYTSIYNIRKAAGMVDNEYLDDGYIETKRKQAENEINSAIFSRYLLPLDEVPSLIENICTKLASGYINYEELREDGEGKKWLGEARALLNAIKNGKQLLLGSDYTELATQTRTDTLRGYPDSTADDTVDERKFRMQDKY
jgi:phage gp36-like protein